MEDEIALSDRDRKIRKHWLIAFWVGMGLNGALLFMAFSDEPLVPLFVFLFFMICNWLLYYCSYKRQGWRLLATNLFFGFLRLLRAPLYLQSEFRSEPGIEGVEGLIVFAMIMMVIAFQIWWYYTSLQLISLNRRLKAAKTSKPESSTEVEIK